MEAKNSTAPKVTIIIPTHNRASLLPRAVNSVLNQTFGDFELLIVDDASHDDTPDIVRGLNYPRVRYVRHDTNRGEAGSRNTGIENARGEYIAYLDDDDEWLPEKLARQVTLLESSPPEVGVVYTGMQVVDLHTRKVLDTWTPAYRGRVLDHLLEKMFPTGATMLARKGCFQKVGMYDTTIPCGPDWEMSIRLAQHFDFEAIPSPLYCYSAHADQVTSNVSNQIAGLERIIELHSHLFARYAKAQACQFVNLALLYYLSGDPVQARSLLRRGIRLQPGYVRPYKLFLLFFLSKASFEKLLTLRHLVSS